MLRSRVQAYRSYAGLQFPPAMRGLRCRQNSEQPRTHPARHFRKGSVALRLLFWVLLPVMTSGLGHRSLAFEDFCINGTNNAGAPCTCGDANFPGTVTVNLGNSGSDPNSTICMACAAGSTYDGQSRSCICPAGSHGDGFNGCSCDPGLLKQPGDGACHPCPAGAPWDNSKQSCSCTNSNLVFNDQDFSCRCPGGQIFNFETSQCQCPLPSPIMYFDNTSKSCQCQGNHVLSNANGVLSCICPDKSPIDLGNGWCGTCPPDQSTQCQNGSCFCGCPNGAATDPGGGCSTGLNAIGPNMGHSQSAPPLIVLVCPPDKVRVGNGCIARETSIPLVRCPPGWKRDGVRCTSASESTQIQPPPVPACPPGQALIRGRCIGIPSSLCLPGQFRWRDRCIAAPAGATSPCPSGQHRLGARCAGDLSVTSKVCPLGTFRRNGRCMAPPPPPRQVHFRTKWHRHRTSRPESRLRSTHRSRRWHPTDSHSRSR